MPRLSHNELSAGSVKAYRPVETAFFRWCQDNGVVDWRFLPLTDICRFLKAEAARDLAMMSIGKIGPALGHLYVRAGIDPPPTAATIVKVTLREIRWPLPDRKRHRISISHKERMRIIDLCDGSLAGLRDRLILMLLHYCKMDRGKIVALTTRDILKLPPSVGKAALAWVQAAGLVGGFLVRAVLKGGRVQPGPMKARRVDAILKRRAADAGLSVKYISSRSMRDMKGEHRVVYAA